MAATAFSFGAPALAADSELVVFDWGGYEDEMFFQDYMKKYGDAPTYSFFSDLGKKKNFTLVDHSNPKIEMFERDGTKSPKEALQEYNESEFRIKEILR